MNRRRFLIACAALLAFAGTVTLPSAGRADARSDAAAKFVQDLGARAIDVLVKPQLARDESMRRFRVLLNEGFDVPYISRFVLGQYWRTATTQQQREYGALFERLIVQVYADRFAQYSGKNLDVNETLKITGNRPEGACCIEKEEAKEPPFPTADQATRTEFGRPRSSIRLRTEAATATSVALASSVWKRSPSPMTCFQRANWPSTRALSL